MAYSYVNYTGNGSTLNYTFSFPYLNTTHITVSVEGVITTAYTFLNNSTITFTSAPTGLIQIRRFTPKDTPIVDFQDGSVLLEKDLDLSVTYNLYIAQETDDIVKESIFTDTDFTLTASGKRISNVGDPVNQQDAVTKDWAENNGSSQVALAIIQANLATTNGQVQVALATTQANLATTNGQAQVALATTQANLATTNGQAQVALATTQATNSALSASASAQSAINSLAAVGSSVTKTTATGSAVLPVGTTAQRDAGTPLGYLRYNSTLTQFEGYGVTGWGAVGGGATGGGTDAVFYLNGQTVTSNYTIPTGQNAGSFGTVTVADGVLVTIPDGSTWSTT